MPTANSLPIQELLLEKGKPLIHCPYQPGNLKITPNACRQRYKAGQRMKKMEDEELSIIKKGFAICRRCPVGRNLAAVDGKRLEGLVGVPDPGNGENNL